jgi:type I restriction enzyme M protein
MAIKKSELYSSLWASCDELRGGMDASQYKDYVLVMLFIKYISDKYAGVKYAEIVVPKGASFQDMVALKGKATIGDDINKKILEPIAAANKISFGDKDIDFNNPEKLGSGKEMVDRLTNLIAIFENPELDFSKNKAEGDDILGDAYEYLMRHFATESGKSKGQFYTPAEVSRTMAKIIGINNKNTSAATTIYDPTCGSGSLLLKVADEAEKKVTVYGQEKDISTAFLSRLNMILHNYPTADVKCNGNSTLSNPLFEESKHVLKRFDFVVANPPFSYKSWSNGVKTNGEKDDDYGRFEGFGVPPAKNGDYAFLLHIIKSLKSKGKGAVILPHGVLFRGNAEATIRENIIRKGYIKGIIGLPANLFYGTGIPACIIVLDKENAENRKGIFMIDASKGFMKDGPKNRLREQDIHKIVDTFNKQDTSNPKYARMVSVAEIADEKNNYNLNIPRYIDSQEPEDLQDIEAHLLGDIPNADIDALQNYWDVYPTMRSHLFEKSKRDGYCKIKQEKSEIKNAIFSHPEFTAYADKVNAVFENWRTKNAKMLKGMSTGVKPKKLIHELSEDLLEHFSNLKLIDKYDVYQHMMTYWYETMQDDVYEISADGWKTGGIVYRLVKRTEKDGKKKEKEIEGIEGIESKLIKPYLLVERYFAKEKAAIEKLEAQRDVMKAKMDEMEEEYTGDEGLLVEALNDKDKITVAKVKERLKKIAPLSSRRGAGGEVDDDEINALRAYLLLAEQKAETEKQIKAAEKTLEKNVEAKYGKLSIDEIKSIVVDDKWMTYMQTHVHADMQRISQRLAQRIKELADRYENTLLQLSVDVEALEIKVGMHLGQMGYTASIV